MNFLTETNTLCDLLAAVAARGFRSEPVKLYRWSDITGQRAVFTSEEVAAVRDYQAKYGRVLCLIRYRQDSFLTGEVRYSASLLEMLSCMLRESSPDYVPANVQRLQEATDTHRSQYEGVDFAAQMGGRL